MELLNPLSFNTFASMNLYTTPETTEKCKWCLLRRERTCCGPRLHPLERKPWLGGQCMLMKSRLITWLKDFLLIWGGARETSVQRILLHIAIKQRARGVVRKNYLQSPHLLMLSSPGETHLLANEWFSSIANSNTELTAGTAAKDDNLLPILMIQFAICILANWELEWDQWVILRRSLNSGPEWNCWPRGESL